MRGLSVLLLTAAALKRVVLICLLVNLGAAFIISTAAMAKEPPQIPSTVVAVHEERHRMICEFGEAELVLRSGWEDRSRPHTLKFVSGSYNGDALELPDVLDDDFDFLVAAKSVEGGCDLHSERIFFHLWAYTSAKGLRDVLISIAIQKNGIQFDYMGCNWDDNLGVRNPEIGKLCGHRE